MSPGAGLFTMLNGRRIGADPYGNSYYEERRPRAGYRIRRWVTYPGPPEASKVPPEWHAWLHHTTDAPIPTPTQAWIKPHQPNLTGTEAAYVAPGTDSRAGQRPKVVADYQAWTPES